MRRHLVKADERARRRGLAARFAVLAATIALTLVGIMLGPSFATERAGGQVLVAIPLLFGLYLVARSTRLVAAAAAAVLVASVSGVLAVVRDEQWLLAADSGIRVVLYGGIFYWVVRQVLGEPRVSLDTIVGAVCAYFVLGFMYANLYLTIEHLDPGGLVVAGRPLNPLYDHASIFYFSYVTLTTVAYGDITPATSLARLIAMTEGMVGQLYPTIFIARLVSLSITQRD